VGEFPGFLPVKISHCQKGLDPLAFTGSIQQKSAFEIFRFG